MRWTLAQESVACEGEVVNGDAVVVRHSSEALLIAVVDAIGHGRAAFEIAAEARCYLDSVPLGPSVREIMLGLHARLRGTRGAAATLCLIRGSRIDGAGVGNVELVASTSAVSCLLTPGILGVRLPTLRLFGGQLATAARLVIFSDGISRRFEVDSMRALSAADACRTIMKTHRKPYDDATVLVADGEVAR